MNRAVKPLYRVVEDYLNDLIDSGQLVSGDLIPSEPPLASLLGVSQGTVKKAIDNLVWENKLYRHQGKGTYVSSIDFNNSLFNYVSYGDVEGDSVRLDKKTTRRYIESGNTEICRKMGIPDSTTHILVGSVLCVGLARGIGALDLRVVGNIAISWVATLPIAAVLSIFFFYFFKGLLTP